MERRTRPRATFLSPHSLQSISSPVGVSGGSNVRAQLASKEVASKFWINMIHLYLTYTLIVKMESQVGWILVSKPQILTARQKLKLRMKILAPHYNYTVSYSLCLSLIDIFLLVHHMYPVCFKALSKALSDLRADMVTQAEQNVAVHAQESSQERNIQKLIDEHTKDYAVSIWFPFCFCFFFHLNIF